MLRGGLKERVEDAILSKNMFISIFLNREEIERLLKQHNKGINNAKPIYSIYILFKTFERLAKY